MWLGWVGLGCVEGGDEAADVAAILGWEDAPASHHQA